jgi:hypothetical protein
VLPDNDRRKKQAKDSQFVIRIQKADRDAFVELCEALDTSAAREIRRFIRAFTEEHGITSAHDAETTDPTEKKPKKKKAKRTGKA